MYAFSFAISKLSLGELQKLQQGAATQTPWVNCSDLNYTFKDSESIQALGVGYELSCKIHLLLLNKNISVYLSVQEQMNNFCLKFRKHILVFRQKSGREKKHSSEEKIGKVYTADKEFGWEHSCKLKCEDFCTAFCNQCGCI